MRSFFRRVCVFERRAQGTEREVGLRKGLQQCSTIHAIKAQGQTAAFDWITQEKKHDHCLQSTMKSHGNKTTKNESCRDADFKPACNPHLSAKATDCYCKKP